MSRLYAGLLACGALACGMALAAFPAAAADTVHLLVPSYSAATAPYLQRLGDDFSAANPNVVIVAEVVPWAELQGRLAAALAAGQPPDLAIVRAAWLPALALAGSVDPLEARMSAEFKARFIGDLLASGRVGGHVYGLPMVAEVPALYYNRDLLDRAGLDAPPADWDALLADAARLKAVGVAAYGVAAAPGAAGWTGGCAILANGGAMLDQDGRAAIASPVAERALRALRNLVADGFTEDDVAGHDQAGLEDMFAQGALAMLTAPQGLLARLQRGRTAQRFGVAPPLAQAGPAAAGCAVSDNVVLPHGSKVRPAAFKFLDFLFTRAPRLAFVEAEGLPPVTRAELRAKYFSANAERALFARELLKARFPPPLPGWPAAAASFDRAVAAVLKGDADPAQALPVAARAMDAALER